MKNQTLIYGIVGLLLGVVLTTYVASNAVNNNMTGMMQMMGIRTNGEKAEMMKDGIDKDHGMGMNSSMDEMTGSLKEKSGDDFDQAFLSAMIVHHQGAIDMADEAKKNAGHEEVKKLADDIISAQTKEIDMMRQWQKNWGY